MFEERTWESILANEKCPKCGSHYITFEEQPEDYEYVYGTTYVIFCEECGIAAVADDENEVIRKWFNRDVENIFQ